MFRRLANLVTATAHAGIVVLVGANIIVHPPASVAETALTIVVMAVWGTAAIHGWYRKAKIWRAGRYTDGQDENAETKEEPCLRESSHSAINSLLHLTVSSIFTTTDTLIMKKMLPVVGPVPGDNILRARIAGSSLWSASSILSFFTSVTIKRQEEMHPGEQASLCGLSGVYYDEAGNVMLLTAASLYAYAIYNFHPLNGIRVTANTLWFFNATVGNSIAMYFLIRHLCGRFANQADAPAAEVVLPTQPVPISGVVIPAPECVIDVCETSGPSNVPGS